MKTATFEEFVSFARTDAGIQERVTEALKSSQPVQDVLAPDEVRAALEGELSDHELEAIAGGSSKEWFAEVYSGALKKTPKTLG